MAEQLPTSEQTISTEIIAVASGKGGTGKTLVVACLGYALTRTGHKVLMIDSDTATDGLSLFLLGLQGTDQGRSAHREFDDFGADNTFAELLAAYDSTGAMTPVPHSINRSASLDHGVIYDALISGRTIYGDLRESGDGFETSGSSRESIKAPVPHLTRERFRAAVSELFNGIRRQRYYDYVLVDTRGGFGFESTDICALANSFIVVTESDRTSFYQDGNLLRRIAAASSDLNTRPTLDGFIVNKSVEYPQDWTTANLDEVEAEFRGLLRRELNVELRDSYPVPLDIEAINAYRRQAIPFKRVPHSPFSYALLDAFARILTLVSANWSRDRISEWNNLTDEISRAASSARRAKVEQANRALSEERRLARQRRMQVGGLVASVVALVVALAVVGVLFSDRSEVGHLDGLMIELASIELSPEEKRDHVQELYARGRLGFDKLDLSDAALSGLDLSGASLRSTNLAGAQLDGADLSDADLFRADLTGANLAEALLFDAQLTEAKLDGAKMAGATLDRARLDGAVLTNVDLSQASLREADLVQADLRGAVMDGADLSGAVLFDANVAAGQLLAAQLDDKTVLPDGSVGIANLTARPVVDIGPPVTIDEGSVWVREGSFTNQTGEDLGATIDFGDGTPVEELRLISLSRFTTAQTQSQVKRTPLDADGTFTLVHTYADDGVYIATVELKDESGNSGIDSVVITVSSVSPSVDVGPDAVVKPGSLFSRSGIFSDPGNDSWTAEVDYGDGAGFQPLAVSPNRTFNLNHTYVSEGFYTIALKVTDDDGAAGIDFINVNVQGSAVVPSPITRSAAFQYLPEGVLNVADFPKGFEQFSPAEFDLAKGTQLFEGFTIDDSFAFGSADPFEFVYGFFSSILSRSDQIAFDVSLSQEEFVFSAFAAGAAEEGVTIIDRRVLFIDNLGEASVGLQVETDAAGFPIQDDIVIFRQGDVVAFLFVEYLAGDGPVVKVNEIASTVDLLLIDAFQKAKP